MDYVYQRTGAGSGFAAHWQSIKETMISPVLLHVKAFQGDGLSFVIPAEKLTQNLRFDREDHPRGENVRRGGSSVRRMDDRTVVITSTHNRKATATEEIRLSTDLEMLTMTLHPTASTPTVMVFKRK